MLLDQISELNNKCEVQNMEFLEVTGNLEELTKNYQQLNDQNSLLRNSVQDSYR